MTPAGWVDSHCHLPSLAGAEAALQRAREAGIAHVVTVGTDADSSAAAIALAGAAADVSATVGLHPHDARHLPQQWGRLRELAAEPGVVAVGEAGFDRYYDHSPVEAQATAFREQIRLAHELDRALVIHTRDAWDDTFRVLDEEGLPARTIFHCFTGGAREADEALERGALLSFSGIVTFKNAQDVRDALARTPLERVLVETDAPYLSPVPHRGEPNEPARVAVVGEYVATQRGVEPAALAAVTRANAARAFGLPLAG